MEPIVGRLAAAGLPIRKIDVTRQRELSQRMGIRALPTFVAMIFGQPGPRIVGATSAESLQALFQQATRQAEQMAAQAATTAGDTSAITATALPAGGSTGRDAAWSAAGEAWPPATLLSKSAPVEPTVPEPAGQRGAGQSLPSGVWTYARSTADLLLATVRLRVRDSSGQSCGSGTLVDARQGEALILTCGHIFRESRGKGTIEVDLFGPQPAENLPGRLICYDLHRDLGLVVIRPPGPVVVARIAPAGTKLEKGMAVISVGCDHGNPPTARFSRITAVDKFVGAANVVASGLPVEGRSGGGLFTEEGLLIGVCNAADAAGAEGLYASLPAIQELLGQRNLEFIYAGSPPPALAAVGGSSGEIPRKAPEPVPDNLVPVSGAATGAPAQQLAAAAPANQPSQEPHAWRLPQHAPDGQPTASASALTPAEEALLANLARQMHQGAELLWIIRSREGGAERGEVLSLDKCSPAFLARLAELCQQMPQKTALQTPAPSGAAASSLPTQVSEEDHTQLPADSRPRRSRILLEFRAPGYSPQPSEVAP
jgi:hypothetical protein